MADGNHYTPTRRNDSYGSSRGDSYGSASGDSYGSSRSYSRDSYSRDSYGSSRSYSRDSYEPPRAHARSDSYEAPRAHVRSDSYESARGFTPTSTVGSHRRLREDNPYLDGESSGLGNARSTHRTREAYAQERTRDSYPQARGRRRRRRRNHLRNILVFVVFLLVVAGIGAFAWFHRPVEITVNGSRRSYTVGTRLPDIVTGEELDLNPGDYVSVGGNVLREGEGNPFSATVNGKEVAYEDAVEYGIEGGEEIELSNGGDVMEPYDHEDREIQPRMVSDGNYGAIVYIAQWGRPGVEETRTGHESGETVTTMSTEVQDCIIAHRNIEPADGRRLVAITFDDGPSSYTETYLRILKEHGAVGTFFQLGTEIASYEGYEELAARMIADGNEICSHTYNHYQLTTLGAADCYAEVDQTFQLLRDAGVETTLIRPPYGDFNMDNWMATQGIMSAYIFWNIDTLDWSLPGADAIVASAVSAANGEIILMHDGGGNRDQDVEALPRIIDELHEQGYEFVTISELMASDPTIPSDIASGNATLPSDAVWPTEIG